MTKLLSIAAVSMFALSAPLAAQNTQDHMASGDHMKSGQMASGDHMKSGQMASGDHMKSGHMAQGKMSHSRKMSHRMTKKSGHMGAMAH